jgi:hypothetical protein
MQDIFWQIFVPALRDVGTMMIPITSIFLLFVWYKRRQYKKLIESVVTYGMWPGRGRDDD